MKKTVAIIISLLAAVALLASCSSARDTFNGSAPMAAPSSSSYSYVGEALYKDMEDSSVKYTDSVYGESGIIPVTMSFANESLAEKIIYTVSADIETVSFNETIEAVYVLLGANGGFIESSYIGGRNTSQAYYGWQTYRSANFTLRIPQDRLNAVTASLDSLGNVVSRRSDADNITSQFFDTQSRLNSYKTQEERLLDMLARADNVTDMIEIESRLADIRYHIESLTSTLRNWQNQVDYSTLVLYISEVAELTEISPVQQRTYWQQIGDGLAASTRSVGNFFTRLFMWIVINLPVLVILAVIVVIIVIVTRRAIRRSGERIRKDPKYPHQHAAQNPHYPQYPQGGQYGRSPPESAGSITPQATQEQQDQQS